MLHRVFTSTIPLKVYDGDGKIEMNNKDVLSQWEQEFSELLNKRTDPDEVSDIFYNNTGN